MPLSKPGVLIYPNTQPTMQDPEPYKTNDRENLCADKNERLFLWDDGGNARKFEWWMISAEYNFDILFLQPTLLQ